MKNTQKAVFLLQNQTFSNKIKKIQKSCEKCLTNHKYLKSWVLTQMLFYGKILYNYYIKGNLNEYYFIFQRSAKI